MNPALQEVLITAHEPYPDLFFISFIWCMWLVIITGCALMISAPDVDILTVLFAYYGMTSATVRAMIRLSEYLERRIGWS